MIEFGANRAQWSSTDGCRDLPDEIIAFGSDSQ